MATCVTSCSRVTRKSSDDTIWRQVYTIQQMSQVYIQLCTVFLCVYVTILMSMYKHVCIIIGSNVCIQMYCIYIYMIYVEYNIECYLACKLFLFICCNLAN